MRILSIGFGLPNPAVDNYNVFTAPSYHDYDALFIDPMNVTESVKLLLTGEKAFEAHDGRAVVNGASSATAVAAADQLRRRIDETQRLLDAGGLVVVMARPNATHHGIVGFEGCDRYHWLPAPAGMSWAPPYLRQAEGKTVRIVADHHPMADVLREYRKDVVYRATFDDRNDVVRQAGRVIAAGGANVPIAMSFPVLAGTVLFIPVLDPGRGPQRSAIAQAVVDACRLLLDVESEERAPAWARSLAIPGLEQAEAEMEEAETAAKKAADALAAVRERYEALASHRRLLWGSGPEFADAVRQAMELVGFRVTSPAGEPLVLEADERQVYVETEASREQVVEWPYVRLQRRLEERLLRRGERHKGMVVVNGHRLSAPSSRAQQYSDALKNACENYDYCLMTGETLFGIVQRALGTADEALLRGVRRRMLATKGVLDTEAALGKVEEGRDAGPIF